MSPTSSGIASTLCLMIVAYSIATAQTPDTLNLFPLEIGNTWTYFQVLDPPHAPPDTLWRGTHTIAETISVNDTLYHVADHPFSFSDTLRTDAAGRVFARLDGRDVILFDFTRGAGDPYTFRDPNYPEVDLQVSVEHGGTATVGAGQFDGIVSILFDDPQAVDEERLYAFAPGVGIVYAYGTVGDYEELYSARVGGLAITATETHFVPSPQSNKALAYPNPFRRTATIILPSSDVPVVRAHVFDMLGRKIAALNNLECGNEECVVRWDASQFPNGRYYVTFGVGEQQHTTKLVLIK